MGTPIEKQFRWSDEDIKKRFNTLRQDIDNTFEGLDENWLTKKTINKLIDKVVDSVEEIKT